MSETKGAFRPGDAVGGAFEVEGPARTGPLGAAYPAREVAGGRAATLRVAPPGAVAAEPSAAPEGDAVERRLGLFRGAGPGGADVVAVERVEGQTLAEATARGPMDGAPLRALARRAAAGLRALHAVGAAHGALGPETIVLPGGDPSRATLVGWGLVPGAAAGDDLRALARTLGAAAGGAPPPALSTAIGRVGAEGADGIRDAAAFEAALAAALAQPAPEWGGPRPSGVPAAEGLAAAPSRREGSRPGRPLRMALFWSLVAISAAGVGVYGATGEWRSLLFPPELPTASPYRLSAVRSDALRVSGHAPDDLARAALERAASRAADGAPVEIDLHLADGVPSARWASGLAEALAALRPLHRWSLTVEDSQARLTGVAHDAAAAEAATGAVRAAASLAGITVAVEIGEAVDWRRVEEALAAWRDCGALTLAAGTDGAGPVVIEGRVRDADARQKLVAALSALLPGREIDLRATALNGPVCRALALLDAWSAEGLEIRYSDGATGAPVGGETFPLGGQPVIDVLAPETLDGVLHVFVVGGDGEAASLTPNALVEAAALSSLAPAADGVRRIRVAWPKSETAPDRPALDIVTPGVNLVAAVVAPSALYGPRIPLESMEAFAAALSDGLDAAQAEGETVAAATRLLRTP